MDEKETSFYSAVLIISIIVGIIIIYFVVSIIRQHRKNLLLHRQSILTEITTLENERSRIAADLHDDVGPVLSGLKFRLASLEVATEDDKSQIIESSKQIDDLIQRMREISFDLMPNTLVRKGLPMAIEEFMEYCNKENKIKMQLQAGDNIHLSEHQAIHLYRIAQELIYNSMKHSGASNFIMQLKQEKESFVLTASDNGQGFDYNMKISESSGLGLRNLLSRTELMRGKMYIESKKNVGTKYTFEIPLLYA